MAKNKELDIPLPSLDELFSTQEQREDNSREKIIDIEIDKISDFPNHPFHVNVDNEMEHLVESIKQNGVLVPALVRPDKNKEGFYEMIAGHRRRLASSLAEMSTLPCIIRNLTDDEAVIIMVDSNLQRENLLPSEKGFAYKMKLEAMKRQGKRTDLTSTQLGRKLESAEILGIQNGESKNQIRRYIRLTYLIPELLQIVDDGRMKMTPAVEVSYIPENLQKMLFEAIQSEDCTPSHDQTRRMRSMLAEDKLTGEVILAIMREQKPNKKEKITLQSERVKKYLPKDLPMQKREEYIVDALRYYAKARQRQNDAR